MTMRQTPIAVTATLLFLFLSRSPIFAQSDCRGPTSGPPPAGAIIKDDNSFETAYGFFPSAGTQGEYVMRVTPNAGSQKLRSVCICWFRDPDDPGDDQVNFNLKVY